MQNKPSILTAIPKRRYKLGLFNVVILGDIETEDAIRYRYIAAVVQEGDPEPGIYLTCEPHKPDGFQMRLVMADGADVIGSDPAWRGLDEFTEAVLDTTQQLLNLGDEEPFRLQ
jgi:hypothetical protein